MKFLKLINQVFKRINNDHINEYTAQCAYFTFLSFIPFIILLLSLIKYINIEKETLIYVLESILPTIAKNSVLDIIQEVYSKSIQTISISAIFTFLSAAKSFYALSLGLSTLYKGEGKNDKKIILWLKGILGTIIVLVSIMLVLVIIVFGDKISSILKEKFPLINNFLVFLLSIRSLFTIMILFIFFTLIYRYVAGKKGNRAIYHMPGALFASLGWFIVSHFFSIYVYIFTDFSVIYGSLATIILVLMWLYTIIYIIFIGAEINVLFSKKLINKKD